MYEYALLEIVLFFLKTLDLYVRKLSERQIVTLLQLNFLLCYGGQQEIVDTAKRIVVKW